MNNLIIENSSKQGPWRRLSQGGITLMFWALWLYFLAPLFVPITNAAGIQLPLPNQIGLENIALRLVNTVLIVVAALVIWSELWARYNVFLHRRRKHHKPLLQVGLAALAKHFQVHPGELALWHQTQLLVIHLNDKGVIRRVTA